MHPAGLPFVGGSLAVAALGRRHRWAWTAGLAAAAANAAFFRHPPRVPPTRPGVVVAPADGQVCLIENAAPPPELGLGDEPRPRVSIFLSVLDAHVQRAPVGGEVVAAIHRPGLFGTADLPAASVDNERNSIVIRTPEGVGRHRGPDRGADRAPDHLRRQGRRQARHRRHLRADPLRLPARHLPARRRSISGVGGATRRGRRNRDGRAVMTKPRERAPEGPLRFLPSAMTVLAICLGLTAIKYALDGRPTEAMALIAAAAILDALDGRMARVLNATSKMGEEIDSLADAINFGVAPAFIVYALLLPDTPGGLDRRAALRGVHRAAAGALQRPARRGPAGLHQAVLRRDARARRGDRGDRPAGGQDAVRRRLVDVVVGRVALDDRGVAAGGQSHPDARRSTPSGCRRGSWHRCWRCWPSATAAAFVFPYLTDPGDHRRPTSATSRSRCAARRGWPHTRKCGTTSPSSNGRRAAQSAGRIPADAPPRHGGRRPDSGYGGPEAIHESTFADRPAEHLGAGLAPRSGPPAPRSRCRPGHPGMGRGFADRLAHHRPRWSAWPDPTRRRAPPCSTT